MAVKALKTTFNTEGQLVIFQSVILKMLTTTVSNTNKTSSNKSLIRKYKWGFKKSNKKHWVGSNSQWRVYPTPQWIIRSLLMMRRLPISNSFQNQLLESCSNQSMLKFLLLQLKSLLLTTPRVRMKGENLTLINLLNTKKTGLSHLKHKCEKWWNKETKRNNDYRNK